jgi:hypothetical protein
VVSRGKSISKIYVRFRNFSIKGSHSEMIFLRRNQHSTQLLKTIFRDSSALTGTSDNYQLLKHNNKYKNIFTVEPCILRLIDCLLPTDALNVNFI